MTQTTIDDCFLKQSELPTLPIIESEEVPKYSYLHVRVTASWFSLEKLEAFLDKHLNQYIVSVEKKDTPEQHFHMHILWTKKREDFSPFIKQFDPLIKGNKHLGVEWQRSDKNPSYVLKDGKYLYKGFSKKQIDDWFKISYAKYTKEDFAKELHKIEDEYLLSNDTLTQFAHKFLSLKDRYKQKPNPNNDRNYIDMMYRRKEPRAIYLAAKELAEGIEYRLKPDSNRFLSEFSYNEYNDPKFKDL